MPRPLACRAGRVAGDDFVPCHAAADSVLLRRIAEDTAAILRRLDALAGEPHPTGGKKSDAPIGDLLRAIQAAIGDHLFTCSDLLLRVPPPADAPLRRAIVATVGAASPRRIGKLLRRYEGVDVDGLRVVRAGLERDGVVWQVRGTS